MTTNLAAYQKQHRAERYARGLCGDCVAKAVPGRRHCRYHLKQRKKFTKFWEMKRKRLERSHNEHRVC